MNLEVAKFASSTSPLGLTNPVEVLPEGPSEVGQLVVVRALTENPFYSDLELTTGERVRIRRGDVIAGILGTRQALRGFVGYAPYRLAAGERVHVLNLGGVVGRYVSGPRELGEPAQAEVLGISPRNLREVALPRVDVLVRSKPIVLVAGSCMNVGKTCTAVEIIRGLTGRGKRVGGAKITGIACLKDLLKMREAGAVRTYSFLDCGVASTVDAEDVAAIARSIAARMDDVDVVVMELGDGILGHYKVDRFFDDPSLRAHLGAVVFCASDLTAAWGGREFLARKGVRVTVCCGPVTDTEAGTLYLERTLGLPAVNSLTQPDRLVDLLMAELS